MTHRINLFVAVINGKPILSCNSVIICESCQTEIPDHLEMEMVPSFMEGEREPYEYKHYHKMCLKKTIREIENKIIGEQGGA